MPKNFCAILMITAFLAAIIAPACGFSWNGKYSIIEICNAQGVEQKIVSNDELPPSKHQETTIEDCQFCFQNHHLTMALSHSPADKKMHAPLKKQIIAAHDMLYQQVRSHDRAARAPPVSIL